MRNIVCSLLLLGAFTPIIVKGTPPTPQAVYVLQRSKTNAQPTPLKKSFVPKIVSSVERTKL